MNLNDNFCKEIFKREKEWIDLSNRNLLNIYYINGKNGLKEFYSMKKSELQNNYSANSKVVKEILDLINDIINKIDSITKEYREGKKVDLDSLINLFLLYKLNDCKNNNSSNLGELQSKALDKLGGNFILEKEEYDEDDYLYDDLYD